MPLVLESRLLRGVPGLLHGFSTRLGGVSEGPHATLDLTRPDAPAALAQGDAAVARLWENRRRFSARLGIRDLERLIEVEQVHGDRVLVAHPGLRAEADGLIVDTPGLAAGVRTADCAPILLASTGANGRAQAVAAVHAGWRGAVAGIVHVALDQLLTSASPERLFAAIGPTIGLAAFEVGEEVVEAARAALDGRAPKTIIGPRGRPHLDLVDLLVRQLEGRGIPREHIEVVGGCTHDQPSLFFSHRRDRGVTGRHLAVIGLEGRTS